MKTLKYYILAAFLALSLFSIAQVSLNSKNQLCVDGKPMLILGGELGNSSATCAQDIDRIFPKLKRMNLNTVLVPVYWELTESQQGVFDFSLTDRVIDRANQDSLKVVFLWFGAWKNSMSCYAPEWFKRDWHKYPRAVTKAGKPLEIASAFSENVFRADSIAFVAWLEHTNAYDRSNTVLMVQIENEIGMLEDARDHSAAANAEYAKGVPTQLIKHIRKNKKSLDPTLVQRWKDNGSRTSGSWPEVFGDDIYTDEYFMAWNYAKYVERLAKVAKTISSRPVYVNAAMNSRGRRPGQYPSAGPLAHLKDIWHAAAPTVDFLSPDLYDNGFTDWVAKYATSDNTLFIPEIRQSQANAAQALYVIGEHNAIGLSPFSIENGSDDPNSANVKGYDMIAEAMPILLAHQYEGTMRGLYFDNDSTTRVITYSDGLKVTASHYFTLPWDPRATNGQPWPATGGVIIRTAPDEFVIAGSGIVLKFENKGETAVVARLGEDGFAEAGNTGDTDSPWTDTARVGLAGVYEVDGNMQPIRWFNGDETHQGRHVRIGVDDFKILKVKIYEYK